MLRYLRVGKCREIENEGSRKTLYQTESRHRDNSYPVEVVPKLCGYGFSGEVVPGVLIFPRSYAYIKLLPSNRPGMKFSPCPGIPKITLTLRIFKRLLVDRQECR